MDEEKRYDDNIGSTDNPTDLTEKAFDGDREQNAENPVFSDGFDSTDSPKAEDSTAQNAKLSDDADTFDFQTVSDSTAATSDTAHTVGFTADSGLTPPDKTADTITTDRAYKVFPLIVFCVGVLLMFAQWIVGLNTVTIACMLYCCICSALLLGGLIIKKKLYFWAVMGYLAALFGMATFYIVRGADAGWGAFTSGLSGFSSAAFPLWQGKGNFGTRLVGNILLTLPNAAFAVGLLLAAARKNKKGKKALTAVMGLLLTVVSVGYVFTGNLRAKTTAFDMSKGEQDYLNNLINNPSGKPNVLVIVMDDLGYGDTGFNGATAYDTPNIDWIAEEGVNFDNFYSAYSVCSPSRFALLTGRYPYRGYADNVIYPTVNTPFAPTRVFNAIEMGGNADGMLSDEITLAEVFSGAGYDTGAFGKWHLGDYGDYLPTNQGFDYFYGSHHVNDMKPFYHVSEEGGEYEIVKGTESLDQRQATSLIHDQINGWITEKANSGNPFFAYYATPWPHAPIYAGESYAGSTGAGIYADCVTEFDAYLGILFDNMRQLAVLDDTVIIFTSDNGPALQGSTNELRGGKYTAYEGGQKVPFYMRWGNNSALNSGRTISASAAMTDIFPTLVNLCGIQGRVNGEVVESYLPSLVDRTIDGMSLMPLIGGTKAYVHDADNPILYMKREKILAVQYALTPAEVLNSVKGYRRGNGLVADESEYALMPFIAAETAANGYLNWKYFACIGNDNPAFPDKVRKNWLICLNDDSSESYQRAEVFPDIAEEFESAIEQKTAEFKANRRGYYKHYYE